MGLYVNFRHIDPFIIPKYQQIALTKNAINSPLKPTSVDAIKRRVRAGMGRCQGGFCFSKVMELIARERKMSINDVVKENKNSRIIVGDIK